MNKVIPFPSKNEYPEYAEMYMKFLKKDGSLLKQMEESLIKGKRFMTSIPSVKLDYRYMPNKWSVKEVLIHIIDDERIYAYRAMAFARNDKTELPGFEETEYVKYANANTRSIQSIVTEYEAVRRATIALFESFSEEALQRIGMANRNKTSVRALGYHIVGHELHHFYVIREKYLNNM
ncbi:DinB family protein [Aquimarina gracilis]|uniref:DinB family protein n=1 Tax=Aquimarina gracilis TaxID=874422 RepID=A0ABU5ZYJ4_9FLAO|nr:DinB family protein [Aquimarina gracilis]MEB3346975.1 DinB family protein [Aquimarina gracilis]